MSSAMALNFLLNHTDDYMKMLNNEIAQIKRLADKKDYQVYVRWHDAGDFFSLRNIYTKHMKLLDKILT